MPSAIPSLPSPAYDVSTKQVAGMGRAHEPEKPDAKPDHTDEFDELLLAALIGSDVAIGESPTTLDLTDTSLTFSELEPTEDTPVGKESTLNVAALLQLASSQNTFEVAPTEETPQASINGDRNNGSPSNNAFSMTVETTPGVQPSEREKYGPNGAVQTHGTSRDRVGSEILSEPTPASDLLNAALEPAFPTTQTVSASPDIPENQWTSDAAVSGGKSSKSETDDSRDSVSGRDSSAVFRQIGAAAERTSSPSETATPALDRAGGFTDLRPSPSSDQSAEKPPSDVSASTSATLFGEQSVTPIGGAHVESLADLAEPQDQAAERPTADTVLGMQLGAEHAGGPANAIGELADPTDAQPTPVARQLAPSLVSHAELSTKDNETQFEMHLDPPELGRVTVHLRQSETGLKAHIVVAREATVPVLERELPILQATLEHAGVTVEGFDVSHHHGGGHFEDDRDVLFPLDDENHKPRSVRATVRTTNGTDWIGVGTVDLQA